MKESKGNGLFLASVLLVSSGLAGMYLRDNSEPVVPQKNTPTESPVEVQKKCDGCGIGHMVVKTNGKTGERFWGCSTFPKCYFSFDYDADPAVPQKKTVTDSPVEVQKKCYECKSGFMVVRTNGKTGEKFWGCSTFPKCRNTFEF